MMILRSNAASPFGRKVKIAAAMLDLSSEITVVTADTNDPGDPLRGDNPLGKIPTLVIEDGTVIYDSHVILEYLDMRAGGGRIVPAGGMDRIRCLTLHALADGLMEAALLRVYEGRYRDADKHSTKWVDMQAGKAARALAWLDKAPPSLDGMIDIGRIGVACALGYLDLRFAGEWRRDYPALVAWLAAFEAKVPSFAQTRVTP
jgi:glutathione S-transferase